MKNKIVKLSLVITSIVMIFTVLVLNVSAEDNILTGTESWIGEFNTGWTGAAGTITSNSINDFKVDMSSIGHWVDGGESRYGAQAKLENKSITIEAGKTYVYTAKIKSDKNRKVFVKVHYNDGTEWGADAVAEEVSLTAGEEYNYSAEFTVSTDVNAINMYYAFGFAGADDLAENSANKIEVSDISIAEKINLDEYKTEKLNEISNYEDPDNSDEIKNIIETAKTNINNATSKSEVDQAYDNFLVQLNIQQVFENDNNQNNNTNNNINNNNQSSTNSNIKTTKDNININNRETDTNSKINDNPLTKDNIIFYFITLVFGVVGLRFMTKKTRKN